MATKWLVIVGGLFLSVLLFAPKSNKNAGSALSAGTTVLALGDSLTAGYGAGNGQDYPSILGQKSRWQVINGGISGNTSAEALQRLPDLLKKEPKLVLISIGGNDFLRKYPESETRENIQKIIDSVQQSGAKALLIGIPQPSLGAGVGFINDHPMYEDLATKNRLPLLSEAWSDVLEKNHLKSDQIHPNAQGYAEFTEVLIKDLKKHGWLK